MWLYGAPITEKLALLILIGFIIEFAIFVVNPDLGKEVITHFGINSKITSILDLILVPIRSITSVFLHGGFAHLLFNLITLISFGPIVERMLGPKEYLKLFFGSAIVGGILFVLIDNIFGTTGGVAIGASAAIAGLLGFLSVVEPNIPVIFFIIPMNIVMATLLFIGFSLIFIISGSPGALNIAHAAHLGGVLFGIYYGFEKIKNRIEHW